jgi:hypothetical protein
MNDIFTHVSKPQNAFQIINVSRQCINSSHLLLHIFSLKFYFTPGVVKLRFHDVFNSIVHLVLMYAP